MLFQTIIYLCAFIHIRSARSTGVDTGRSLASVGDNPWVVHITVAVSTSGFLNTCAGSLIDGRWVLTSASCITDARFIWIRYGAVDRISPQLVTELTNVRQFITHPEYDAATGQNDIALLDINRYVLNPPNSAIQPVALATDSADLPESAKFCNFGIDDTGAPGDVLSCVNVAPSAKEDGSISADAESTEFDVGAPLVQDGVQYGILTKVGESSGFLNPAAYLDWIQEVTGVQFGSDNDGDNVVVPDNEGLPVNFVN
ncbi:hypothetical protein ABMA27_005359 [Loxostege sticticalis]|uniref:Peptidase S1 domain-containing protein n=1 Tax=Loxostege sticticalis TaxID=481309 RepID=A0ABR3HIW1_LOXSC